MDDYLKHLYLSGVGVKNIAELFERSEGAITSRLIKLFGDQVREALAQTYQVKPTEAENLLAQGYRGISNKHKIVARIDRDDWIDHMARTMNTSSASFMLPTGRFDERWSEHYLRCHSNDKLTVSEEVYKEMKQKQPNTTQYIPKPKPKENSMRAPVSTSISQTKVSVYEFTAEEVKQIFLRNIYDLGIFAELPSVESISIISQPDGSLKVTTKQTTLTGSH